eukprot:TRINITY_DN47_c0_g7_i1.p1 TRINITY_DN47_c0_g7~~TRINITY_DN47_c0_g7_i1.p1  ORF type:complete len:277 (+),score=52.24 TRINITY_DN47_c0_g7_i1:56-886(+)
MLMTLQEPPPNVDTYDDDSFRFSTTFRDLVSKCLNKDPALRPTTKELLKHKFFSKHARKPEYVESVLLRRVTKLYEGLDMTRPLVRQRRDEGNSNTRQSNEGPKAPVTCQSWVFPSRDELKFEPSLPSISEHCGRFEVSALSPSANSPGEEPSNADGSVFTFEQKGRFVVADLGDSSDTPAEVPEQAGRFVVADVSNEEPPAAMSRFQVEDVVAADSSEEVVGSSRFVVVEPDSSAAAAPAPSEPGPEAGHEAGNEAIDGPMRSRFTVCEVCAPPS